MGVQGDSEHSLRRRFTLEVDASIAIGVHFIYHVFNLGGCGILSERFHDLMKLGDRDGSCFAMAILVWLVLNLLSILPAMKHVPLPSASC
jgi:hypothetical protein